jgi:hypothetical protein
VCVDGSAGNDTTPGHEWVALALAGWLAG